MAVVARGEAQRCGRVRATRNTGRRCSRRTRNMRVRAGDSDPSGSEFMNSPIGKFISGLSEFAASSPINKGKIALVKAQAGQYDVEAAKANLQEKIASAPVVMFSFPNFCKKAKAVLDEMNVPYTAFELTEMGDEGTALRAELAELTGRTSVPNTFIAGEGIGGCNDGPGLMTLKENGKLVPMLQAAGVLE